MSVVCWDQRANPRRGQTIDDKDFQHTYEPDDDLQDWDNPCKRNKWKEHRYPNCNSVHEIVLELPTSLTQDFDIKYLGYVIILIICYLLHAFKEDVWNVTQHDTYLRLFPMNEYSVYF